jgi:hypothetical protein
MSDFAADRFAATGLNAKQLGSDFNKTRQHLCFFQLQGKTLKYNKIL